MRSNKTYKLILAILPLIAILLALGIYLNKNEVKVRYGEVEEIKAVSTGESMAYEGNIKSNSAICSKGEVVKVSLKIKNITQEARKDLEVKLVVNGNANIITDEIVLVKKVDINEELEISWDVMCNGGSIRFTGVVGDKVKGDETVLIGGRQVNGEGWFSGDIHIHSTNSDGENSVGENLLLGYKKGLGYVNLSDHGTSKGYKEGLETSKENKQIVYKGSEWSTKEGHCILMNIEEDKNYSLVSFDEVLGEIGSVREALMYIAHPFRKGEEWKGEYKEVNGIEVWNGKVGPYSEENLKAFKKWDELNKEGKHIYGVAGSDSNSCHKVGLVYLNTYAKEYSKENILEGHLNGNMYGTNGPLLSMKVNQSIIGDDCAIASLGEVVKVNISGQYYEPLDKIVLIRNGEVILEKVINSTSFNIVERVRVAPGDFIRVEVLGKEDKGRTLNSLKGYENTSPFAFSNPIFFTAK